MRSTGARPDDDFAAFAATAQRLGLRLRPRRALLGNDLPGAFRHSAAIAAQRRDDFAPRVAALPERLDARLAAGPAIDGVARTVSFAVIGDRTMEGAARILARLRRGKQRACDQ